MKKIGTMIIRLAVVLFGAVLWGLPAQGALMETYNFSGLNKAVPDGSASGVFDAETLSSGITSIGSISVTLTLSGNYNGDLYISLSHGSGFSVLLNRVGSTAGNPSGYSDSGLSVTLSDSAVNGDIHTYRGVVSLAAGSPLTGTWQPDARNVDPGSVVNTDSRSAFLSSFNGTAASGNWTLFAADLDSGGNSTLVSWGLELSAVPEPVTVALVIFAGLFVGIGGIRYVFRVLRRRRKRRRGFVLRYWFW